MVHVPVNAAAIAAVLITCFASTCAMNPVLQQRLSSESSALVPLTDRAVTMDSEATRNLRLHDQEHHMDDQGSKHKVNMHGYQQVLGAFCEKNENFPFKDRYLNCVASAKHLADVAKLLALDVLEELTICQTDTKSQTHDTLLLMEGSSVANGVWELTFETKCTVIVLTLKFKPGTYPYQLMPPGNYGLMQDKTERIYIQKADKLSDKLQASQGIDCGKYVFSTYFSELMKHGVLTMIADRSDPEGVVGYTVWPRYGFDTTLQSKHVGLLQSALLEVTGSEAARNWLQEHSEQGMKFSTIFGYVKGEDESVAMIKNMIKAAWAKNGETLYLTFDATEQGEDLGPVTTLEQAVRERKENFSKTCPPKLE